MGEAEVMRVICRILHIRSAQLTCGPKSDFPQSIFRCLEWSVDEQACLDYLFECRWPEGVAYPRCGATTRIRSSPDGCGSERRT